MTAGSLLKLYPRAWRDRYGDELVQLVGQRSLSAQQVIDILAGALDAWLSPSVRAAARRRSSVAAGKGALMVRQFMSKCAGQSPRYTVRDSLIGAAIVVGVSFAIVVAGIFISRAGHPDLGDAVKSLSYSAALMISMPFWIMKGQSRTAQAAVVGTGTLILIVATLIASRI